MPEEVPKDATEDACEKAHPPELGYAAKMLWRLGVLGLLALASCNAIVGFSGLQRVAATDKNAEETPERDGGSPRRSGEGGTDGTDGSTTGTTCDKTKPFGPAVALDTNVNSPAANETSPTLTANELSIIFQRLTGVNGDISDLLIASRASRNEPFGAPRLLDELNRNGADYSPTMTPDGLLLFYVELTQTTPQSMELYIATRPTPSARFGNRRAFTEANTTDDEFNPFISANGNELWFTRDGASLGSTRLERAVRDPDTNVFKASTTMTDPQGMTGRFSFSKDMLTVYTNVLAQPGTENYDLSSAHRETLTSKFGPFEALPGAVNSGTGEGAPWISEDECRIYFASGRNGNQDIFVAERVP
jgi:hypothetical protein